MRILYSLTVILFSLVGVLDSGAALATPSGRSYAACDKLSWERDFHDGYVDVWPEDGPSTKEVHIRGIHGANRGRVFRKGDLVCFKTQQIGNKRRDGYQATRRTFSLGCGRVVRVSPLGAWVSFKSQIDGQRLRRCDTVTIKNELKEKKSSHQELRKEPTPKVSKPVITKVKKKQATTEPKKKEKSALFNDSQIKAAYVITPVAPFTYQRLLYLAPRDDSQTSLWGAGRAPLPSSSGFALELRSGEWFGFRPAIGVRYNLLQNLVTLSDYDGRTVAGVKPQYNEYIQVNEKITDWGLWLDLYSKPIASYGHLQVVTAAGIDLDYSTIKFTSFYNDQNDASKTNAIGTGKSTISVLSARLTGGLEYNINGWSTGAAATILLPFATPTSSYSFSSSNPQGGLSGQGEKKDTQSALGHKRSGYGLEILLSVGHKL